MIADVFARQMGNHQPRAGISVTSADMLRRSLRKAIQGNVI